MPLNSHCIFASRCPTQNGRCTSTARAVDHAHGSDIEYMQATRTKHFLASLNPTSPNRDPIHVLSTGCPSPLPFRRWSKALGPNRTVAASNADPKKATVGIKIKGGPRNTCLSFQNPFLKGLRKMAISLRIETFSSQGKMDVSNKPASGQQSCIKLSRFLEV